MTYEVNVTYTQCESRLQDSGGGRFTNAHCVEDLLNGLCIKRVVNQVRGGRSG